MVGGGQTGGKPATNGPSFNPGGEAGKIVQAMFEMKAGSQAAVVVGAGGGTGSLSKGGASSFGNVTAAGGDGGDGGGGKGGLGYGAGGGAAGLIGSDTIGRGHRGIVTVVFVKQ